jgi:AAA15 family ATPase/GTPase
MAFYGPNASGKTNILKAASVFCQLAGKKESKSLSDFFDPNLLNNKYQDTMFSARFILNGDTYLYSINYNSTTILDENLEKNGENLFNIHNLKAEFSKRLFTQAYRNNRLTNILRVECSNGKGRQTTPFLTKIGQNYQELNKDLKNAHAFMTTNIITYKNKDDMELPRAVDLLASTLDNNKEAAMAQIIDILHHLTIDISTIQLTVQKTPIWQTFGAGKTWRFKNTMETQQAIHMAAIHKNIHGKDVFLDFAKHESAGTQRLAGLVGLLLFALKTGRILLVDELESSLPPCIVRELIALFKQKHRNKNGAQLIFTTHDIGLLSNPVLQPSEITLTYKNLTIGTATTVLPILNS